MNDYSIANVILIGYTKDLPHRAELLTSCSLGVNLIGKKIKQINNLMDSIFSFFHLPIVLYFHIKPDPWLVHSSNFLELVQNILFRSTETFQQDECL